MLFLLAVSTLSALQTNRLFRVDDVLHLVSARHRQLRQTRTEYGDVVEFESMIQSTRTPQYAIISHESGRMHYFLHDNERICRCMWDGAVGFDEKEEIAKNMLTWWTQERTLLEHRLVDYEDGLVFSQVVAALGPDSPP